MLAQETKHPIPRDATLFGDSSVLDMELLLVLNSRQSKTPVGADEWVRGSAEAVRDACDSGFPLIASIGMNTWELVLWAVGENEGHAVVILPTCQNGSPEDSIAGIAEDFALDASRHSWVFIAAPRNARSRKAWWERRDELAFNLAARLAPVSVRAGGRWDTWLGQRRADCLVDERFRVPHNEKPKARRGIELPSVCAQCQEWDFLTHWTRRCYGPWPDERSADYYRDVTSSGSGYPRSAMRTLERILQEGRIRASGDHIRKNRQVVAFTALPPADALPLMRWRKRYVRPTFEPYGIAIRTSAAIDLGVRPVTYIESGKSSPDAPEFTQGYGTGDWPREAEWRALGDVDLGLLRDDDALVLVPTPAEAEAPQTRTRFPVRPLSSLS